MDNQASIESVIRGFAERFNPEMSSGFTGNIHLMLTGPEIISCTLCITVNGCHIEDGLSDHVDCEIRTRSDVFRRIVNKVRSPQEEFIMGNIYISNLQVIQRIGKAFK